MFIARKNVAARFLGFPKKIFNDFREFVYAEKIKYCEHLSPRVEKARLIREIKDPERLCTDNVPDFDRVVGTLEWIVNTNTADTLLAAELLRDIARHETRFKARYGSLAGFMLDHCRREIIKTILYEGASAEEMIERLLRK
ncbi:hypothetical protein NO2_0629 [Candidatus Termititenax persephonae]|uniref:Uncharacterized protein n=1 Tax=Candidatus Termititenax persephonae TaxID=2218525 RepID=A0A388TG23_9BACT|nr:hypothetical protein NO2_0629 [Candidatus Termititenax persephonae]